MPESETPASVEPAPEIEGSLILRRTVCYGRCPNDSLFVDSRGNVAYAGRDYTDREGLHMGRVSPDRVHAILASVQATEYFELGPFFSRGVTDNPTVYTAAAIDGRWNAIRDYARGAPQSVIALETSMADLLEHVQWDEEGEVSESCDALAKALQQRCEAGEFDEEQAWLEHACTDPQPGVSAANAACAWLEAPTFRPLPKHLQ